MPKWKRPRLPRKLMSWRTVCKEVDIPLEKGNELIQFMIDSALDGYLVNVPRFGRFWLHKLPSRRVVMPITAGSTELREFETGPTHRLRFRQASTLQARLRRQVKGKAKGTA